jgi:hypothetical protein
MARQVLRFALMAAYRKGVETIKRDAREAGAAADLILQEHFEPFLDRSFFPFLFGEANQTPPERRLAWRRALRAQAERALDLGLARGPTANERQFQADARGKGAFYGALFKHFPDLKAAEVEMETADE